MELRSAVHDAEVVYLDALGQDGPYRPKAREVVRDIRGYPAAELAQVPRSYAARSVERLRSRPAPTPAPG